MDLQQLRYFVAVGQLGTIQGAADVLYVSRQAVSKALMQLEEELGYPLLNRAHSGVSLSEQGRLYFERATALVSKFDALEQEMHQKATLRIRIALPFTTHHYFFSCLEGFISKHAGTWKVELISRTDAVCHALFEAGKVDMAVSHLRFTSGIDEGVLVASSPICMAINDRNPLARRTVLRTADLQDQPLVYYMNGYEDYFWLTKGTKPPAYAIDDVLLALDLVQQDKAIFPVPLLSVPQNLQGITLVPYEGPDERDDFCCGIAPHVAEDKRLLQACRELRTALARAAK